MDGWLTKQGGRIRTWRRRWFRLKGNTLFYYLNPQVSLMSNSIKFINFVQALDPKGSIRLEDYSVERHVTPEMNYEDNLDVTTLTPDPSTSPSLLDGLFQHFRNQKKFCFKLVPHNPNQRTYFLCADTESELNQWLSELKFSNED